jgi:hypothetical protein
MLKRRRKDNAMTNSAAIFDKVMRFPYVLVLSATLTIASFAFIGLIIGNIVH